MAAMASDEDEDIDISTSTSTSSSTTNSNSNSNSNSTSTSTTSTVSPEPEDSEMEPVKKKKKKKDKKKKDKKKKKKKRKNQASGYKRILKELQQLLLKPPVGVTARPKCPENMMEWIASIEGPEDTPYHGGKFYLNIKFGEKYPFIAPKVTFKTKIYHCNVNHNNGEICLDVLKDNYSAALTIEKILLSLQVLLQHPNPDDPLVADIAQVYKLDKQCHDQTAKEWTHRYAQMVSKKEE